jgi:hypothetical protein
LYQNHFGAPNRHFAAPTLCPTATVMVPRLEPFKGDWQFTCGEAKDHLTIDSDYHGHWSTSGPGANNPSTYQVHLQVKAGQPQLVYDAVTGGNPFQVNLKQAVPISLTSDRKGINIANPSGTLGLYRATAQPCQ